MEFEPWIETYSGKKFHLLDPKLEDIDIIDIAHSLSMQCRFTGHTVAFYSVAEHSVITSVLVSKEKALEALLHDASEAYLSDIAGPLKPHIKGYKEIEDKVMEVIAQKFKFDWPLSYEVHEADKVQLKTEAQYLLATNGEDWVNGIKTGGRVGRIPKCFGPEEAKYVFLARYEELTGRSKQLELFADMGTSSLH